LLSTYGQFTPAGIQDETTLTQLRNDDTWKDFATKIIKLYEVIDVVEGHDVSYPWITYLFTGMSDKELYDSSYASNSYYKNEDNYKLLNYFNENKKPIKDYIDKFAIKTSKDDPNNPLGVDYGFLTAYSGYKTTK